MGNHRVKQTWDTTPGVRALFTETAPHPGGPLAGRHRVELDPELAQSSYSTPTSWVLRIPSGGPPRRSRRRFSPHVPPRPDLRPGRDDFRRESPEGVDQC